MQEMRKEMQRIFLSVLVLLLLGTGTAGLFFPEWFESPVLLWIHSKFSFVVFVIVILLASAAILRITIRARRAMRNQANAVESHLRNILEELVQDSQALGDFLRTDLPQIEDRLKSSREKLPKEVFSSFSSVWTRIRTDAEAAFRELEYLPMEPELALEKEKKHSILEYKDLLNRHTKSKAVLERVRSDLSLLKEKLREKGC